MDAIAKMPTYEAYKDSGVEWLGEIPDSWQEFRLKYVFCEVNERSSSGLEDLLSVSQYTGVRLKSENLSDDDLLSTAETLEGYKLVEKNDLVSNIMLAWNGSLGFSNYRGIVSPAYSVYRLKRDGCPKYFHYLLRTEAYKAEYRRKSTGVIESRLRLYSDDFFDVIGIFPSLEEQTLITNFLDQKTAQIDEAIAIKEQQVALLKERKQIIIQKAVTQGLDPDVPMKDSGVNWIGEIPAHWEVIKLKYLFSENTRKSSTGEEVLFSLRMELGLVPHNDVSDKPIPAENLIDYKIVDKGQMVMNRMRASIGIFGIAKGHGLVSPDYAVFDVSSEVIAEYYLTFFKLPIMGTQFRLASKGMGTGSSGFMRLYTDEFGDIKIANPPKEEQEDLMRFIEESELKTDASVGHLQTQIEKLKEYKTTLINSAVTGKIRITPDMVA